jgi:hypothetical protein
MPRHYGTAVPPQGRLPHGPAVVGYRRSNPEINIEKSSCGRPRRLRVPKSHVNRFSISLWKLRKLKLFYLTARTRAQLTPKTNQGMRSGIMYIIMQNVTRGNVQPRDPCEYPRRIESRFNGERNMGDFSSTNYLVPEV